MKTWAISRCTAFASSAGALSILGLDRWIPFGLDRQGKALERAIRSILTPYRGHEERGPESGRCLQRGSDRRAGLRASFHAHSFRACLEREQVCVIREGFGQRRQELQTPWTVGLDLHQGGVASAKRVDGGTRVERLSHRRLDRSTLLADSRQLAVEVGQAESAGNG